jgi:hypothetical protein
MLLPLGYTIIDWTALAAECQRQGIDCPTRHFDEWGVSANSPAAFLAVTGNLRFAYREKRTDIVQLVWLSDLEASKLAFLGLRLRPLGESVIISGTLTQYMDVIIGNMRSGNKLLPFCNALFAHLDRAGLRDCFHDYTIESFGTSFTIKERTS